QETDAPYHRKREKAASQEPPNPATRFCFHAPNCVQRVLKLTENASCAEKRERNTNNCGDRTFTRLRCLLRDVLHDLHGTGIEKIAHLLRDLVPRSRWIVPRDDPNDSEQNENQRRERKDCVICKRRA